MLVACTYLHSNRPCHSHQERGSNACFASVLVLLVFIFAYLAIRRDASKILGPSLPKVIPLFLSLQAGGQAFFSHSPESSRTAYIVCCAVLKLCALVLGRFRINRIDILCPRRHRTEISKIPMYADSILKMLKDIRKTVRASSKLQPGPNAFAQFLEEVSTHSTR